MIAKAYYYPMWRVQRLTFTDHTLCTTQDDRQNKPEETVLQVSEHHCQCPATKLNASNVDALEISPGIAEQGICGGRGHFGPANYSYVSSK